MLAIAEQKPDFFGQVLIVFPTPWWRHCGILDWGRWRGTCEWTGYLTKISWPSCGKKRFHNVEEIPFPIITVFSQRQSTSCENFHDIKQLPNNFPVLCFDSFIIEHYLPLLLCYPHVDQIRFTEKDCAAALLEWANVKFQLFRFVLSPRTFHWF